MPHNTVRAYHSTKLDAQLHARLRDMGISVTDAQHAQRDVSVVGGLISTKHVLYGDDATTIVNACKQLSDANIPIHSATKFYFYNMLPPVSCDFLEAANPWSEPATPPQQSALLVVCGICSSQGRDSNVFNWLPPQQREGHADFSKMYSDWELGSRFVDRLTAVSPFQIHDNMAWPACADAIGASFIITRGGTSDEINSLDFLHEGTAFSPLIDTAEAHAIEYGTISGSLGILVRQSAVQGIARTTNLNPQSMVGKRLLALQAGNPPPHRARPVYKRPRYGF
ncbi:MAG: hypothetical protein KGQ41_09115 [Alphaproteobacteria bacterium]|nr:hypothetical protein [Alphaproteobacteria bacterium]